MERRLDQRAEAAEQIELRAEEDLLPAFFQMSIDVAGDGIGRPGSHPAHDDVGLGRAQRHGD